MNNSQFFLEQRSAWMLRAPAPTPVQMQVDQQRDRNRNPHNEPGKPLIRDDDEIVVDRAIRFADMAMIRIYGIPYRHWLQECTKSGVMDLDVVLRYA